MTKCVRCQKECEEERIRQKRDGSVLIKSNHIDGFPAHLFHEYPSISAFMYRPYPGDVSRRRG